MRPEIILFEGRLDSSAEWRGRERKHVRGVFEADGVVEGGRNGDVSGERREEHAGDDGGERWDCGRDHAIPAFGLRSGGDCM